MPISTSVSIAASPSSVWNPGPTPTSASSQAPSAVSATPRWATLSNDPKPSELDTFYASSSNTVNLESVGQLVEERMKRGNSEGVVYHVDDESDIKVASAFDNSGPMPETDGPNPHDRNAHYLSMSTGATVGTIVGASVGAAMTAAGIWWWKHRHRNSVTFTRAWPASRVPESLSIGADHSDVELGPVHPASHVDQFNEPPWSLSPPPAPQTPPRSLYR